MLKKHKTNKITIILIKKEFGIMKTKATAIPVHKQFYVLHYYAHHCMDALAAMIFQNISFLNIL